MRVSTSRVMDFLDQQRVKHAALLPMIKLPQVLTFMGTTGAPGSMADLTVHRLLGLETTADGREMRVKVRGNIGRALRPDECVTASINSFSDFRGYQVKTCDFSSFGQEQRLLERNGEDTVLRGKSVFTVHNSPNVLALFEQIPWEDVQKDVGSAPFAILGVGEQVNISPRLIWHHGVEKGRLCLYHGDGYVHKTFLNLQKNACENRLVLDLDTLTGYCLRGKLSLLDQENPSPGTEKVIAGFASLGWSAPRRSYCLTVEEAAEVVSWK